MILVSQDEKTLINFNNVLGIRAHLDIDCDENNNPIEKGFITIRTLDYKTVTIAKYLTEERAKEVLQEIFKCYESKNYETEYGVFVGKRVYYMPEK